MLRKIGFFVLLGLVLMLTAYLLVVFKWAYSSGERAGWVQKFSRKGWICKTWEGELAMLNLPGTVPEKFFFTVREDAVAQQIERAIGQRVTLHYDQHRGLPGNCFGDTEYWVDRVDRMNLVDVPAAPGLLSAPSTPAPLPALPPAPLPASPAR